MAKIIPHYFIISLWLTLVYFDDIKFEILTDTNSSIFIAVSFML